MSTSGSRCSPSIGFGGIGFMDDLMKLRRGRNLGLTARGKMALQIVLTLMIGSALAWLHLRGEYDSSLVLPFFKEHPTEPGDRVAVGQPLDVRAGFRRILRFPVSGAGRRLERGQPDRRARRLGQRADGDRSGRADGAVLHRRPPRDRDLSRYRTGAASGRADDLLGRHGGRELWRFSGTTRTRPRSSWATWARWRWAAAWRRWRS